MPSLTVEFTEEEFQRLKALAEYRKMSPQNCLRSFVRNCQPGGSRWVPPEKAAQLFEAKKRAEKAEPVLASERGQKD